MLINELIWRSVASGGTALVMLVLAMPLFIRQLRRQAIDQPIRDDGPAEHLSKAGTPTMGGVLVLSSITLSTLLWGDLSNLHLWVGLIVLLGFGLLGFVDDWRKLIAKSSRGLLAKWKYVWQSILALSALGFLYFHASLPVETTFFFPFLKTWGLPLGLGYIVLGYFVIVGSSNAVNLTDGLDGLAIFPVVCIAMALGIFAYLTSDAGLARHFVLPHIPNVGELLVFCSAVAGAGIGFLWFNSYPAQIFMGDVGSLGLGAALGALAMILRQEVLLFIMGGVFVLETLSVILQVGRFKISGKRFFRMAPIHHHFELKGWSETQVVTRFWIITILLVVFSLLTLT